MVHSRLAFVLVAFLATAARGGDAHHSPLWGERGELWSPASRLPDFSHAGFERGEKPIPTLEDAPRRSVLDFGAVPDDDGDDTAAFVAALNAEIPGGPCVVEAPPGRYIITGFIDITRSGVVLRGAGEGRTTLSFPRPLNDVQENRGATTEGRRTSNWSWSGGFLRILGKDGGKAIGPVVEPARRGDAVVVIASAADLVPGDEVRLAMSDESQSLVRYLYADDPGPIEKFTGVVRVSQVFRVTGVAGNRVELDRPLRFDVRPEWKPELYTFQPSVTHAGIEGLTLEFPAGDYEGHFTESGYNGIAISGGAAHCWVRDVRLVNAESGIFLSGRFCTLTDITLASDRTPDPRNHRGHHGVLVGGEDNLFTRFALETRYIHDITVGHGSIGNVISNGRAVDLALDHHRRAPYENLFTHLDAGKGSRLWASGGGAALGKHAAARNTYWNLRAAGPIPMPPDKFAPPMINLVGVAIDAPPEMDEHGRWFEPLPPPPPEGGQLQPADLHEAQLARRLGGE